MTEPAHSPRRASVGTGAETAARHSRSHRHPLLAPFPLTVMALATFLVVFALMAARLRAPAASTLSARSGSTQIVRAGGRLIRTSASGRALPAGPAAAAGEPGSQHSAPAIVTASSGSASGSQGDD
jgi:hypothetical protein